MDGAPKKTGGNHRGVLRTLLRFRLVEALGEDLSNGTVRRVVPGLRKRLYTTDSPRHVHGTDVLYALLCYTEGEPAKAVASRFRAARLTGMSNATLCAYARRVAAFNGPLTARTLIDLLAPPERHAGKLSRVLVDHLDAFAGEGIGLPELLRWRRWYLTEVTFFVRTGQWPPRVLLGLLEEHVDTTIDEAQRLATVAAALSGENEAAVEGWASEWAALQRRADDAGVSFRSIPLAKKATREGVRVALLRGTRPQRWQPLPARIAGKQRPHVWVETPRRGRPRESR